MLIKMLMIFLEKKIPDCVWYKRKFFSEVLEWENKVQKIDNHLGLE